MCYSLRQEISNNARDIVIHCQYFALKMSLYCTRIIWQQSYCDHLMTNVSCNVGLKANNRISIRNSRHSSIIIYS